MTHFVFSGKLPILRFRILTAANMWKNAFFDHPFASDGCHSLKLALNNLLITLKWLLTCFEFICSFLLSLCANKRLYVYVSFLGTGPLRCMLVQFICTYVGYLNVPSFLLEHKICMKLSENIVPSSNNPKNTW